MAKTGDSKYRAIKDPHADCPSVEEYELRRRDRLAALPKTPKP